MRKPYPAGIRVRRRPGALQLRRIAITVSSRHSIIRFVAAARLQGRSDHKRRNSPLTQLPDNWRRIHSR
jgi:hypothetical protein